MHLVRPISQISRWLLSFLSRCRWSDPSPWRATLCRQTKNKEGAINKDAAILQQEAFVSLQDYKLQVAPECSAFKYGVYTLAFCLHLSAPTTTRVFVGHVCVCVWVCIISVRPGETFLSPTHFNAVPFGVCGMFFLKISCHGFNMCLTLNDKWSEKKLLHSGCSWL